MSYLVANPKDSFLVTRLKLDKVWTCQTLLVGSCKNVLFLLSARLTGFGWLLMTVLQMRTHTDLPSFLYTSVGGRYKDLNEPVHDRTNTMTCPPSLISLRFAHNWQLGTKALIMRTVNSDQTGQPRLIWVFAGRTNHFVGFVVLWLKWGHKYNAFVQNVPNNYARSIFDI